MFLRAQAESEVGHYSKVYLAFSASSWDQFCTTSIVERSAVALLSITYFSHQDLWNCRRVQGCAKCGETRSVFANEVEPLACCHGCASTSADANCAASC